MLTVIPNSPETSDFSSQNRQHKQQTAASFHLSTSTRILLQVLQITFDLHEELLINPINRAQSTGIEQEVGFEGCASGYGLTSDRA